MICSGLCFLPFIENPPALKGLLDSHNTWISFRGARQAEVLQIRTNNGVSPKGLSLYDQWLRKRVRAGISIDKIIAELLPASGGTFNNPATTYYQTETTPQLLAENVAQTFLGTRIQWPLSVTTIRLTVGRWMTTTGLQPSSARLDTSRQGIRERSPSSTRVLVKSSIPWEDG